MKFLEKPEKYIKFAAYFVVLVLINVVGATLFFRADLTENRLYSLSRASKEVAATLSEPLTINVFFTENLPAPHNNTRRYLRDLLEEYAIHSNRYFNYRFYDIASGDEIATEESERNMALAGDYGINPVQIRIVEKDEVKFKKAYMGLVIIHGDLMEKIPAVTSVDGLEYQLTMAIKKLNNKISTLLALPEKIRVKLYMSSSLKVVAPFMGLNELPTIPDRISETVEKINAQNYGKIEYTFTDPTQENNLDEVTQKYNLMTLKWPDLKENNIKAGSGTIGMVMEYGEKAIDIPLLNVLRIPIIGTRYELTNMDELDEIINGGIESLIDINAKIGYLADKGTINRHGMGGFNPMMGNQQSELSTFNALLSQSYTIRDVKLDKGVSEEINSLIIANPTEEFSDYELFQIDQALMSGKNLALFLDAFKETQPQGGQFGFNQGPSYVPINTGLEKLLSHYGVKINPSYVMDENCFKQTLPRHMGGGEQPLYFAPLIQNRFINQDLPFMHNIKGLITMKASPLKLDEEALGKKGIKAHTLFSSSDKSWEMKGMINLNPMFIRPPQSGENQKSRPLACLLEGEFTSYFAGKPIPEKKVEQTDEEKKEKEPDLSAFERTGGVLTKSKPAKIILVSSAEMLKDNMLDPQGQSPNATFVQNVIDTLNNRDDIAEMRSKRQSFNPLDTTDPLTKTAIKSFNIGGLPGLVILFGIFVWLRRKARRKSISMMFES